MKIICAGDIHLGRISSSLSHKEFSSKDTFSKLIDEAIDTKVELLLLCGDIIDNKKNPFTYKEILNKEFEKLKDRNVEVVIIPGNHDLKRLEKIVSLQESYDFVHLIGKDCQWEKINVKGLDIYGFGFDRINYNKNPFKNISTDSEKYILMIHGDYTSNKGDYAPFGDSINCEEINNSIITLVGHIHKYEKKDKLVNIGSLQALDFGELGKHGYYYLELDDDFNIKEEQFVPFSSVFYDYKNIDVSSYCEGELDLLINSSLENEAKESYYRLKFEGRLSKENALSFKEELSDLWEDSSYVKEGVYVDKENIIVNTLRDYDIESMCDLPNAIGVVAKMIKSIDDDSFISEYIDFYKKFKKNYEEKLSRISNGNFEHYSDLELLGKIKETLIKILDGEIKK